MRYSVWIIVFWKLYSLWYVNSIVFIIHPAICLNNCWTTMGTAPTQSSLEVTRASWNWGTRYRCTCTSLVPHVGMLLPSQQSATSLTRWGLYASKVSWGQSSMMVGWSEHRCDTIVFLLTLYLCSRGGEQLARTTFWEDLPVYRSGFGLPSWSRYSRFPWGTSKGADDSLDRF